MQAFYSTSFARVRAFYYITEVLSMRARRLSEKEQFLLITECRQSGLSDHQWCMEHDINPATFYNWASRLRKKACYEIPAPAGRGAYSPTTKQDIVRIDILPEIPQDPQLEQKLVPSEMCMHPAVMEITINGCCIRITNHADHMLLAQAIGLLKGAVC